MDGLLTFSSGQASTPSNEFKNAFTLSMSNISISGNYTKKSWYTNYISSTTLKTKYNALMSQYPVYVRLTVSATISCTMPGPGAYVSSSAYTDIWLAIGEEDFYGNGQGLDFGQFTFRNSSASTFSQSRNTTHTWSVCARGSTAGVWLNAQYTPWLIPEWMVRAEWHNDSSSSAGDETIITAKITSLKLTVDAIF